MRGTTTLDNFLLALIIASVVCIIISPYFVNASYGMLVSFLELPPGRPLPWWWLLVTGILIAITVWIMLSSF